jgi:serine/threonine protein kinase
MQTEFQPGTYIDRYRVDKILGTGGSGIVYRVFDQALQRPLAVKVLNLWSTESSDSLARFEREARILSQMLHKNIVRVYRFGFLEDNTPFMVMELLEGESLRSILQRRKQLPCHEAIEIAEQVSSAMEYAHSQNVIHRDLKPENITIVDSPEGKIAKLLDFGLCKRIESNGPPGGTLTETGFLVGSVNYMSPEQCMGAQVDQRADIYAFGCVLYEMITGSPPFVSDTPGALLVMHVSKPMPGILDLAPDSKLPQELDALLCKCCHKNKEDRYQGFTDIRKVLTEISQMKCQALFVASPSARSRLNIRKLMRKAAKLPPRLIAGAAFAALLLSAGTLYFINCTDRGRLLLAAQLQSTMSSNEAIDQLSQQLGTMVNSGQAGAAAELVETTTKGSVYQQWPHKIREALLQKYIAIYSAAGMSREAFSLTLLLLQELLESQIESLDHKLEKPDYALLEQLSRNLVDQEHSRKQWAQINQIIEVRKKAFNKVSGQLAWAAYLRSVSGLRRENPATDNNPRELARVYEYCVKAAIRQGDPEFIKRVASDASQFNLKHELFSFETSLHTDLGLYQASLRQMDQAKAELAVAEHLASKYELTPDETDFLPQLQQSCREGRYIQNSLRGEKKGLSTLQKFMLGK